MTICCLKALLKYSAIVFIDDITTKIPHSEELYSCEMNINPDQQFTFAHYTCMSTHAHTRTHAHARTHTHTHSHLHTLQVGVVAWRLTLRTPQYPKGREVVLDITYQIGSFLDPRGPAIQVGRALKSHDIPY